MTKRAETWLKLKGLADRRMAVEFSSEIDEYESYPEAGMRAVLTGVSEVDNDGVVTLHFDFEPFDAHNLERESRNYFDKQGQPCLTAREAGFYKPKDTVYADVVLLSEQLPFTVLESEALERSKYLRELHAKWVRGELGENQAGFKRDGYIKWLEEQIYKVYGGLVADTIPVKQQ